MISFPEERFLIGSYALAVKAGTTRLDRIHLPVVWLPSNDCMDPVDLF